MYLFSTYEPTDINLSNRAYHNALTGDDFALWSWGTTGTYAIMHEHSI